MRKKIVFFIAIVLLCFAGWGFYLFNKPHEGVGGAEADITIQATDLYQQYSTDEAKANAKYINKIIAVTGTVSEVNKENNTCTILLKKENEEGGVSCNLFTHTNTNAKKGETLTIKGRCTGFLMDVALADCVIEP